MVKYLILLILLVFIVNFNFIQYLRRTNQMLVCYNAGGNGYLAPFDTTKCGLVPRGKGW